MTVRFYRRRYGARLRGSRPRSLLVALAALLFSLPAGGEGLLQRVDTATGTAWLLGSLHFASDDLYPLGETIERAFAASDRLMVEVNLLDLDPERVAETVQRHGVYPQDDALRRHVPEALWQRVVQAGQQVGLAPRLLERQRPWLAALTLTRAALEHSGLEARQGIDQHFMRRAQRAGIPILELESFRGQIELLAGIPLDEQLLMLEDTLTDLESGRSLPVELLSAWREGDAERLEAALAGPLGASPRGRALARRLLHARNAPMAQRIAAELRRGGTVFVVVGAAHMVGAEGLGERLAALGLEVSRH